MRRVARPLLLSFLVLSMVGFSPALAPTALMSSAITSAPPMFQPPTTALAIPGRNPACTNVGATRICASVSTARAAAHTYVTVNGMMKIKGVGQAGQIMTVTWRSKVAASCSAVTDANGMASCSTYFPGATKGRIIRVKVTIGKHKLTTHFTSK